MAEIKYSDAKLARDDKGSILQVGSYRTDLYQNLDGSAGSAITAEFTKNNTVVRLKSYSGDNWITISDSAAAAVSDQGLLLEAGEELTLHIANGDYIATIGGILNIVPVSN